MIDLFDETPARLAKKILPSPWDHETLAPLLRIVHNGPPHPSNAAWDENGDFLENRSDRDAMHARGLARHRDARHALADLLEQHPERLHDQATLHHLRNVESTSEAPPLDEEARHLLTAAQADPAVRPILADKLEELGYHTPHRKTLVSLRSGGGVPSEAHGRVWAGEAPDTPAAPVRIGVHKGKVWATDQPHMDEDAVRRNSGHFFSRDTMRWHGGRMSQIVNGPRGTFVVHSTQGGFRRGAQPRDWGVVHIVPNGTEAHSGQTHSIRTVYAPGDEETHTANGWGTRARAITAATNAAHAPDNREHPARLSKEKPVTSDDLRYLEKLGLGGTPAKLAADEYGFGNLHEYAGSEESGTAPPAKPRSKFNELERQKRRSEQAGVQLPSVAAQVHAGRDLMPGAVRPMDPTLPAAAPRKPFGLPKRLASHLAEIRNQLPASFRKVIARIHTGNVTNAETEALGTTLKNTADASWEKFRGSDEWTGHLNNLIDHGTSPKVTDALERLGSGTGKLTSVDHLSTIHDAIDGLEAKAAAEAAKRGQGTPKQQTAAALKANAHAQHAAAIKAALNSVAYSDASRLRDLHGNYNWGRMGTGVKLDKQVHDLLAHPNVAKWLEAKNGGKRVLANTQLAPVGPGERPGSRGFVDDKTELQGAARHRALLYKFRDDPTLLKALRGQVKWDSDRHGSYKTGVDDHIKRSVERHIMRLEDEEADKDSAGTKVAPAKKRLVNQQLHARFSRVEDALNRSRLAVTSALKLARK